MQEGSSRLNGVHFSFGPSPSLHQHFVHCTGCGGSTVMKEWELPTDTGGGHRHKIFQINAAHPLKARN